MGERAVITLVTSDGFVVGACVLAFTLRKEGCGQKLVVMVTSDLTEESTSALAGSFDEVIYVDPIPNPNQGVHVQAWKDVGFTKLRLWEMVRFETLVYVDADCVCVQAIDNLFDLDVDFAAAPDIFPPDNFNAGVMVVRPNKALFEKMLRHIPLLASYDGGDTGFLNAFFPDW